jgi:hypothetical protein
VNLADDPRNCGGCDRVCEGPPGRHLICCAGECKDATLDPGNCGGCRIQCETGQICCGGCHPPEFLDHDFYNCGECRFSCQEAEGDSVSCCAGACVDLKSDPSNCRFCGLVCEETCENYACIGGDEE